MMRVQLREFKSEGAVLKPNGRLQEQNPTLPKHYSTFHADYRQM